MLVDPRVVGLDVQGQRLEALVEVGGVKEDEVDE